MELVPVKAENEAKQKFGLRKKRRLKPMNV
jgi:hypothetical protein